MDTSPKQEPRWLGNYRKESRNAILQAAIGTGKAVEWRNEPNELMSGEQRAEFGSVWSAETDLSSFWRAFREATAS